MIDGDVAPAEVDPELPVLPESSEFPEFDVAGTVVVVAPVLLPELPDVVAVFEDPACSLATTTPMSAVRPVAPSTEALVSVRTRDQACCRPDGVMWGSGRDMSFGDLRSRDAPT